MKRSGSNTPLVVALTAVVGMSGMCANEARGQEAQSGVQGRRFWLELGLGYGHVERKASSGTLDEDSFALNFAGGWRITPQLAVGFDLGGYNLEATCLSTPSHICTPAELERGKGIEHLFVVADFRPSVRDGWVLHAGIGWTGYWAQSASQYYNRANSHGWGAEIGTGYTWRIASAGHIGARAGYEFGHLDGNEGAGVPAFDYSALKVTVIFAYY